MGKVDRGSALSHRKRKKLATQRGLATARTTVVLVVDGDTEKAYFKKLETLEVFADVRFKPILGDDNSYDTIFKENFDIKRKYLILDIDCSNILNPKHAERIRAILSKRDMRTRTFFNNYSFETFLLNHVKSFGRPITNQKDYDSHMEKSFGVCHWSSNKNVHNTKLIIENISDEAFETMLKNIKMIYKENCFENPSSNMHLLFDKLKEIK